MPVPLFYPAYSYSPYYDAPSTADPNVSQANDAASPEDEAASASDEDAMRQAYLQGARDAMRNELDAVAVRLGVKTFVRSLGLLAALELEAPASVWQRLGAELATRRLSLHVDGKRGTAIFSPPLCIREDELVAGVRAFGDAARAVFGAAS